MLGFNMFCYIELSFKYRNYCMSVNAQIFVNMDYAVCEDLRLI